MYNKFYNLIIFFDNHSLSSQKKILFQISLIIQNIFLVIPKNTLRQSVESKTWRILHSQYTYFFISSRFISNQPPECNLFRSSHQRCSIKIGVLKNLTKFTGKHLCQSLFFNKVAGLRPATLLKKRLWHRCFPVNFAKFLRAPFSQNTSGRLLQFVQDSIILQTSNNLKLQTKQKCFIAYK